MNILVHSFSEFKIKKEALWTHSPFIISFPLIKKTTQIFFWCYDIKSNPTNICFIITLKANEYLFLSFSFFVCVLCYYLIEHAGEAEFLVCSIKNAFF